MKYRKKPVVVDAYVWLRITVDTVVSPYARQSGPGEHDSWSCAHCGGPTETHGWIKTLEGGHIVCPGDWIITGVEGEQYPCKPDIFKATYEAL